MIPPERFLVSRKTNPQQWWQTRRFGISATTIAKSVTPAGLLKTVQTWGEESGFSNDYTKFGTASEEEILMAIAHEYDLSPSEWLIAGENPKHFATPDGISRDHRLVAEVKTTGKPWDGVQEGTHKLPILYRRQIQWQLHCTSAEACVFIWQLRVPNGNGWYKFGWDKPKTLIIERDEEMIDSLKATALQLETHLKPVWEEDTVIPW